MDMLAKNVGYLCHAKTKEANSHLLQQGHARAAKVEDLDDVEIQNL
jgi:hypothetical protein